MLSQRPLPPILEAQVQETLARDEKVLLHLCSDLTQELKFGERWLIVTSKKLLVYPAVNGDGKRPRTLSLHSIESAEIQPVVGGGVLMVRTKEGAHPLLHFSNSLSARFAEAAKGIQQLATDKPLNLSSDLKPDRCPTCGRLLPDPHERCPFCVRYFAVIGRIVRYLKPYAWYTAFAALLTAMGTGLMLIPPAIYRHIIDHVIPEKDIPLLGWMVLGFLTINVLNAILAVYNGKQLSWLGGRVATDIRSHVFQAVERLSIKFFDRRHVGNIMSRVMNDSDRLQGFLIEGFPFLAQNALMLIGILSILFYYSVPLTLLIMLPIPIMILGQFLFWKYVRILNHKAWNQFSLLNTRLAESISGVRVVKAFSQEQHEMDRFDRQNNRVFDSQFLVDKFWAMFHPGMHFLVTSGILIVWYMGGRNVINAEMTFGTLIAFIAYLNMFYGPLQYFSAINNWMTRAFVGAERIFETIDTTPEAYDPPDAIAMPTFKGEVEFRNVTFSYEKGKPALKDVSFKIRRGEVIGLVGRSGSGKSTLLALLCRFYQPDEGQILIDGVPIEKIRLEDLRQNIGLVFQESFLFGSSIFENISYSRPDTSADPVIAAAHAANAHEFIMHKPDAYDTKVGERGNRLSGGEKQRVAIARAILHNPRLLILDEATSSVDSETEAKIQQAMERLVKDRTTLIAAHRLSTLRNTDRVFVMDEGRLAEIGSHAQLMHKEGIYFRLVRAQEEAWRKAKKHLSIGKEPAHV